MSTESHPSPTGSSNSSLFGGGGNAGANETMTQSSPAKPTWAQILNSNPGSSSSNASASNNNSTANTANNNKNKTVSPSNSGPSTSNASRSGAGPNYYEQQQTSQSSMNWPVNYGQSSSWIIEDDSQKHAANPTNTSQQSVDGDHAHTNTGSGDGFDRRESSSPASERNKSTLPNNSAGNGWPNMQQQHSLNNPSRSNQSGNQWLDMNNIYGTNSSNTAGSFNFPQHSNESNNPSNTWQDPSSGNADTLSSSNASVINKQKASSTASSITGTSGGSDTTINYVPQPKLVEQLGWDEPDIQVTRRPNFDDGTSIWGDPSDLVSVPVKKWTDGSKAAIKNTSNTSMAQSAPAPASAAVGGATSASTMTPSQVLVQRPTSISNTSAPMMLNDESWPKQQSPTLTQAPPPQWNDQSQSSNLDSMNLSQTGSFRNQPNNWNTHSPHPGVSHGEEWFREGVVDTSSWGLQGSTHKVPFDPYDGQVDTSAWGVSSGGAIGGAMPNMPRNRFMNEFSMNENPQDPHQGRMGLYETGGLNDICRPNPPGKSPIISMNNMPPNSSNMQTNQNPFISRPNPHYPQTAESMTRTVNSGGGLSTPPSGMMNQQSILPPKMTTSSPIPTSNVGGQMGNKPTVIPNHLAQPPTPQPHLPGNGNNPNGGNNNGGIHAHIMQQFRLAVQAGLISQDLLNTKLPPHMLQLLQKLFEYQQKFQNFSMQLNELIQQKSRFPPSVFQNEHERISKEIQQKKQEMISVQKEIQEAHNKLKQQQQQQQSGPMNPASMMSNVGRTSNPDQSRLHQWTRQSNSAGPRSALFPGPPPGIPPKDWVTDNHDSNDNWEPSQTNESNPNNPMGNVDNQIHQHHQHQASSGSFNDPFPNFVDDIEGPPPFIPGQLWNWKSSSTNAEDDPHVTPGSFILGPKGLTSAMLNLNVGGGDSAFTNPPMMHQYQRQQQPSRSQWQQGFSHDQPGFVPSTNDWNRQQQQQQQQQQQFRGTSKPPHPPFGSGYRPYP